MGRPQKTKKKAKIRFKTKAYIGNESTRKELMLKDLRVKCDSLQNENTILKRQVDSLQRQNDSIKVTVKTK